MPPVNGSPPTSPKCPPVTIATVMPEQFCVKDAKLHWLEKTLAETDCDLLVMPQEYIGGHYCWQLAKNSGAFEPLHVARSWMEDHCGRLARKYKKHLAVGGCCFSSGEDGTAVSGATEDYLYFDDDGKLLGYHTKFALPSYDDMRTGGHGQLWPETNFKRRVTPIDLPKLRLRVGTVFCWEVFSQMIWPCYSLAGVNLITHPIKFAPRGWLINKVLADGKKHIVDFGYAPQSQIWIDRLLMASRHQVICPIAVSCNSWNLGVKKMAVVGHVDEIKGTTDLHDVPSVGSNCFIHTFQMVPEYYSGLDHHHSAGAFAAHVGNADGFSELGQWTMHGKIRRLESHLIGGTTTLDCVLKSASITRQKKQSMVRGLGSGMQRVQRKVDGEKRQ